MTKTKLLLIFISFSYCISYSQVFSTSATLKPLTFSAGFEPGIYINGETRPYIFFFAGAGLIKGVDFGLKCGLGEGEPYLGGDVEFGIGKYFSLSFGAHSWYHFGLDATALITIPLTKGVRFYTGGDSDIVLVDDSYVPIWIPLGFDITIKHNLFFVFESEINLTDDMPHYIGTGLNVIF